MRSVSQLRTKYWSWKSREKMVEWNRTMMTKGKPGIRSWRYASFGEPTCTTKDTSAICGTHTWMVVITTPGLSMRHTTFSGGVKKKLQPMALRVMGCHLHKVGSSGTYPVFDVTVANKWDTTLTCQSAQTTSQVKTKTMIQMLGTMAGPHKKGAVSMP